MDSQWWFNKYEEWANLGVYNYTSKTCTSGDCRFKLLLSWNHLTGSYCLKEYYFDEEDNYIGYIICLFSNSPSSETDMFVINPYTQANNVD